MRRRISRWFVVLGAGAFVFVPAPDADAKTVDVGDWASGFCETLESWQSTASKAHDLVLDVIDNGVPSSSAAKAARTKIVNALDAARKKSSSASKAVKALGTPDITNGAKISAKVSNALGDVSDSFADAKDDAAHASTDPKKFRSAMKKLSSNVDSDLERVGDDLDEIDTLDEDAVLDQAFTEEPTCSFLTA